MLRLLLTFVCLLGASAARAQPPTTLYQTVEESLEFDTSFWTQPFTDIDLDLDVQAPEGRVPAARFVWFGFHDGNGRGGQKGDVWKYRLNLDTPGRWIVTATFRRPGSTEPLTAPRTFTYEVSAAAVPGERGHVGRDPRNPQRLAFADGTPWVPFPIHGSFLLDQTQETAGRWLDQHAALGVNALAVRFHAEAANALGVPGNWHFLAANRLRLTKWPGRDGAETGFDYTRLDLASWHHNEAILAEASRRGIRLHIWFGLSGDNRQYRSYGPQDWSKNGELGPQQRRFIRHFLARWAPLPVWWHWTVDSEYEEGPGDDLARDRAWAAELQRLNPWPTLVSTHVLREWSPERSPEYDLATLQLRVPAEPARVVADSVDFVRRAAAFDLPVYNAEGVWMLPATATRLGTLAHLFAGGYSHVAHDSPDDGSDHRKSSWGCEWETVNPRHREDAAMLGALARFFNAPDHAALNHARIAPERVALAAPTTPGGGRHALCLHAPGEATYVWLDEGGSVTLDLSDSPGLHRLTRHTGPDFAATALDLEPIQGGARVALPAAPQSGYGRDTLYVLRPIDTPPLAIFAPAAGAAFRSGGEVELRWASRDPAIRAVRVEISTNGGSVWTPLGPVMRNSGSARVTLPKLPPGPVHLKVGASKRPPAPEARVEIAITPDGDVTPPVLALIAPADGTAVGAEFTLIGRADDPSGLDRVEVRVGDESTWRPADGLSAWSLPLSSPRSGPLRLEVRAKDLAVPPLTSAPLAVQLRVDADAPKISDLVALREAKRIIVTWRTDEPASSRVQWGAAPGIYESDAGVVAENVTAHRVVLPLAAGPLHLIAISADSVGNTATSAEFTLPASVVP